MDQYKGKEQQKELVQVEQSDHKDTIQSRIIVANKLGRNLKALENNVYEVFGKKSEITDFAKFYAQSEGSIYKIPRKNKGVTTYITGLSINVVKDLAQIYSHLIYGIKNVKYKGIASASGEAYCLDLVNNTSHSREFFVSFPEKVRTAKNFNEESYKYLYQIGMKRVRTCIEKIIPYWMTEGVYKKILYCKESLSSKEGVIKNIWKLARQIKKDVKNEVEICNLVDFALPEDFKKLDIKSLINLETLLAGKDEQDLNEKNNPQAQEKDLKSFEDDFGGE